MMFTLLRKQYVFIQVYESIFSSPGMRMKYHSCNEIILDGKIAEAICIASILSQQREYIDSMHPYLIIHMPPHAVHYVIRMHHFPLHAQVEYVPVGESTNEDLNNPLNRLTLCCGRPRFPFPASPVWVNHASSDHKAGNAHSHMQKLQKDEGNIIKENSSFLKHMSHTLDGKKVNNTYRATAWRVVQYRISKFGANILL